MTTTTSTAETMSLAEALRERRSVRGYRPEPVPQAVLDEVFGLAQLAPSNCNIQPWKVFVASGAMRDELRHRMVEHVTKGDPIQPDFESGPTGPLGYVPALWEQISRTTLIITLRYHAE